MSSGSMQAANGCSHPRNCCLLVDLDIMTPSVAGTVRCANLFIVVPARASQDGVHD